MRLSCCVYGSTRGSTRGRCNLQLLARAAEQAGVLPENWRKIQLEKMARASLLGQAATALPVGRHECNLYILCYAWLETHGCQLCVRAAQQGGGLMADKDASLLLFSI